jgi:membrane protease YdiL (CAAX protease family)
MRIELARTWIPVVKQLAKNSLVNSINDSIFYCIYADYGCLRRSLFWGKKYGARFDHIEANLSAYLIIMALVWTHGSFFEELFFRAFIITTLSKFCGGRWPADLTALFVSSVFFGYRYAYYQGLHGAFITGAGGLLLVFVISGLAVKTSYH